MGDYIVELSTENNALKNNLGPDDQQWFEKSKAKFLKQIDDGKRAKFIMSRIKKQMENIKKMTYISYVKLWESEIDNIVSQSDKLQDLNINQLKVEVHDAFKKDEKLTSDINPINNEDVINKGYLDENMLKTNGR